MALVGWLAALYAVSSRIVMGRFARLERADVVLNLQRARAALSADLDELDSKAGDWSTWDDAYTFMSGENPDFIAKNVSDQNFIQLKLDLMAFVDTSNRVVFTKGFDDNTQKSIEFPRSLLQRLTHHDMLVQHADANSRHDGLLLLPDSILLVASRPILNTQRDRPPNGTLVFGRYLESDEVKQLSQTTHNSLAFYRIGERNLPADVVAASREASEPGGVAVRPLDDRRVAGYTVINDIYGEPALWLRLEMPRDIYAQGRLTMNYFLVALLVISVLFGTIAQALLQKVVFHRLARKQSEQRYRAIVEQAAEGILLVDVDTQRVLETNASLQTLLGYSAAELQRFALRDFALRDSATDDECSLAYLMQKMDAMPVSGERQVRRKDGSWVCVEVNANLISSGESQILCVVFHDVSERRKAEEELRQSEERFRLTVGQVHDYAIYMLDPQGRVATWNAGAERTKGYAAAEILGRHFSCFHTLEDIAVGRPEWVLRTAEYKGHALDEGWRVRKDGSRFWAEAVLTAIRDERGQLRGFAEVTHDLTNRKQLEQQLLQSQKVEAIGRLAGGVAHDFNNILTAMIGYCQLTLDELKDDHPARANVVEIAAAAERAAALTRQLLAFSRKQTLQPKVLDLNAVVGDMDKMLRRLIGEDIELVTKLTPGIGSVKADPGQLEQVILNLAVNARDAMPSGGRLILETANTTLDEHYAQHHQEVKPGDYVVLAVTDTGSGMTDEVKSRLFEPFFTTKPQGKGTGLGLATCYGVVKQSGGHISVYSELDRGTTFKVYLPRVNEAVTATPAAPSAATSRGGNETILLVEDDPAVRGLNARLLRAKGYSVIEAGNGEEALRVASQKRDNPIALLLTDVVMPEMGGKELAERFHATQPDTKVLFCSGYTQEAIDRNGELEPGTAFLQKPFTPLVLANKIREVLEN